MKGGGRGIAVLILTEVNSQINTPTSILKNEIWCPLNRRLDGPQTSLGVFENRVFSCQC